MLERYSGIIIIIVLAFPTIFRGNLHRISWENSKDAWWQSLYNDNSADSAMHQAGIELIVDHNDIY